MDEKYIFLIVKTKSVTLLIFRDGKNTFFNSLGMKKKKKFKSLRADSVTLSMFRDGKTNILKFRTKKKKHSKL
jgi:hypothetical protein